MILCCGDALIDMLPAVMEGGAKGFAPSAGGAAFNTAIALGRLGEKAGILTGLSHDPFGRQLEETLAASNVDTSLCLRSSRPTTLAFVTLRDGLAEYSFHDENTAGRMISPADLPMLSDDVTALHFGAVSLIGEPCGGAYEALAARECGRRIISIDPNIRPGFVHDEAAYRARLTRMLAIADIIKVSREDLAWLAPDARFSQVARRWLTGGASLTVLTQGAREVAAIIRGEEIHVASLPVEVVDTIGAGDSFDAGLLAGLRRAGLLNKADLGNTGGEALRSALRLAVRTAALTVSRAGADPPWAHEMQA